MRRYHFYGMEHSCFIYFEIRGYMYEIRDIMFTLVVNDFGVRYGSQDGIDHLESTLKLNDYKITVRPEGDQYLGMIIAFNTKRTAVTLSMLGYVSKMLVKTTRDQGTGHTVQHRS